jgi:hypothetical protein
MPTASQAQLAYHQRAVRAHPVGRRHRRERIRHANLLGGGVQDERVRVVQLPPSRPHLALVAQLGCCRRAAELDERRVRAVPEIEEPVVDPPTLPRAAAWISIGSARVHAGRTERGGHL